MTWSQKEEIEPTLLKNKENHVSLNSDLKNGLRLYEPAGGYQNISATH